MTRARSQSRRYRTRRSAPALSAALALGVACLCAAAPARADSGSTIIERCTHGQSLGGFSQQAYRRALAELPTEVEEYSDCGNLIRRAQLAAAGAGSPGAGTIATPLTPAEQRRVGSIAHTAVPPILVGTQVVRPGVIHADISSALNSLPNALIAILAVVLTGALTLAGRAIRDLVANRRPH